MPDAFHQELALPDGRSVVVARATPDDVLRIRWLYHRIYGGSYPFSLVYNPQECAKAIESDRYVWLLAKERDQAVGSVIFTVQKGARLGKVFGGVVSEEFQGQDLASRMLTLGVDGLVRGGTARTVYATTRTVSLAPQRLAEKAGFKKLGIFPNVHRVQRSETHTLAVYFGPGALEGRGTSPRLPLLLKPFFELVRRETGLPEPSYVDAGPVAVEGGATTPFEVLQAPQFILRRFHDVQADGRLALDFFPFHEPNLLLISPDGKTEIFLYRSPKDGHCVVTGARSETLALAELLDHGAAFLEDMGVRYIEVLVEAGEAERLNHALGARFLPSAYYPAMRWEGPGEKGRDYVVLSRSLTMLDFKGIALQPAFQDYLREYFRLWKDLHVGRVLP
ncbi:MAG: GNAT family N-acetyltransferase [Elusimicrobia bacterium]|nr:GNAT family N-acetyltransferase [Elusimicrobiota bacterium]